MKRCVINFKEKDLEILKNGGKITVNKILPGIEEIEINFVPEPVWGFSPLEEIFSKFNIFGKLFND